MPVADHDRILPGMRHVPATLVRQLQQRTGAGLAACRRALESADGDLDAAESHLRSLDHQPAPEVEELGWMKNQFLIAMPSLQDDNFRQTVSLLCEHNEEGAIGLVVNRPTELKLSTMMEQLGLAVDTLADTEHVVFWGGPVQTERGFVVHGKPGGWESCMTVADDLFITTSRDILNAISEGKGPKQFFVTLGYAGWGAGQLEAEILQNAWLNTPASARVLFAEPPPNRWQAATRLLGLDVMHLSGSVGRA